MVGLCSAALFACAYFNTFYNAKKYYGEGERLVRAAPQGEALPIPARTAFEKSIEKSSAVLASHPGSGYADDALLLLGKAHYHLGNFPQATAALQAVLDDHPQSGLRREAAPWLVKAARRGGDSALAARLADELLAGGNLERAERFELELERAQLALDAGEAERAARVYEELEREDRQLAHEKGVGILLAQALLRQGDTDSALRELGEVEEGVADPELRQDVAVAIAEALEAAGRMEEARQTYRELLGGRVADSLAARLHLALAESYRASGDASAAVEELASAAGLVPSTALAATALYQRGLVEWRDLGARDKAKQTFLEAYLQDPATPASDSATAAARAIQEIQHYEAILEGSKSVLAPLPPDEVRATATYLLAELLYVQEGDRERARALFSEMLERYPRSAWAPKVLYTLGWLTEEQAGTPATGASPMPEAADYYRRLIEEFPHVEYAGYARERLAQPGPQPVESTSFSPGAVEAPGLGVSSNDSLMQGSSPIPEEAGPVPGVESSQVASVESLDAKLLAFSRALPRAEDPLVGIQDRLLARRREKDTLPGGRDSLIVKGDSLIVRGDSLIVRQDSLIVRGDSLIVKRDSLIETEESLPAAPTGLEE